MSRSPLGRLHLVTDRQLRGKDLVEAVAAAVRGGADVVHLREPGLPARELFELALQIREALGVGPTLLINDRLDVALAAQADGVQLGGGSLPISVARTLLGPSRLIGSSVHSLEEAVQAEKDGVDFLVLGTIYPSRSHPGGFGSGPTLVRQVVERVSVPVIAIGGLDATNTPAVLQAGARGIAVISAILADSDPEAAARRLSEVITAST